MNIFSFNVSINLNVYACRFVETSTMNSNYNPNCRYSALKYSSCALLQLLVELQKIGTCGTRISMNLSTESK